MPRAKQKTVRKKKPVIHAPSRNVKWTDRELLYFAVAAQRYGFSETEKIAEAVKTKDETAVKCFIKTRTSDARSRSRKLTNAVYKPRDPWRTPKFDDLHYWPAIRKWRKLAYNQMPPHIRCYDYSRGVMQALCKQFYEEEKEPEDIEAVNTKAIYKFILDCIHGNVPANLPPKESSVALMLLQELKEMINKFNFKEETDYLKKFKRITTFVPFQVKDEFKKKIKNESSPEAFKIPNSVPIPEDLYILLNRHKKILKCFNPLTVPLWLLNKEQEYIEEECKT